MPLPRCDSNRPPPLVLPRHHHLFNAPLYRIIVDPLDPANAGLVRGAVATRLVAAVRVAMQRDPSGAAPVREVANQNARRFGVPPHRRRHQHRLLVVIDVPRIRADVQQRVEDRRPLDPIADSKLSRRDGVVV